MNYSTDLRIEETEMNFLLALLKDGGSLAGANKIHNTNYGMDEDIFLKRAYFEDCSYVDLSIYTGNESIMSSIYMNSGDNEDYIECDDGFNGDCEFKLNGNTYNVSISSIKHEYINVDNFSGLENNGVQEYFNIKCPNGSIDILKNIGSDEWFGIIHYNKGGDLLIPKSNCEAHMAEATCFQLLGNNISQNMYHRNKNLR